MKITIAGKAIVFTSDIELEDLERVAKYRPDALQLKDGDRTIFSVAVKNKGVVSNAGIFFDGADEAGYACATLVSDEVPTKEFVVDTYGTAVARMNQLEAELPAVVDEIAAQDAAVKACIQQL